MPGSKKVPSPPGRNTDHLVRPANRLLSVAARIAWSTTKFLARVAIRIPGWAALALRREKNTKDPLKEND